MLEWYKPDQGVRARGTAGVLIGLLGLHGLYQLYGFLSSEWWRNPLPGIGLVLGDEFAIEPRFVMVIVLLLAAAYGLFRLLNHPKVCDFLIETEAELKKVAWASKREVVGSSIVVVITVIILALFIFGVDWVLIKVRGQNWDAFWAAIFG